MALRERISFSTAVGLIKISTSMESTTTAHSERRTAAPWRTKKEAYAVSGSTNDHDHDQREIMTRESYGQSLVRKKLSDRTAKSTAKSGTSL